MPCNDSKECAGLSAQADVNAGRDCDQNLQIDLAACFGKGETRLAHKMFDQIQGAEDGSLVTHHGRGSGVPKMKP